MKKLLVILSVLILIVIGAIVAIPMFVSADKIKVIAEQQVKEKTGRDLKINGAVSFTLFPNASITINDASFSNPKWADDKNMLSVAELSLALETMPLLDKNVKIKHITLIKPVINLEKAKDGKVNWDIKMADAAPKDTKAKDETDKITETVETEAKPLINSLTLGDIKIENAVVNYTDKFSDVKESLDNINLNISAKDFNSSAKIIGDIIYKSEKVKFDTELSSIQAVLDGDSVDNKLNISSSKFDVKFNGKLSSNKSEYLKGDFDVNVPSISGISKWLGKSIDIPFEKISFKANADVTSSKLKLSKLNLNLDEINGTGDARVYYKGAKPSIYADLKVNKINMDRFLNSNKSSASKSSTTNNKTAPASSSSDKVDLSGLKLIDLDLKLQTSGLSVMGADIGANILKSTLKNAVLDFSISETSFFGGNFKMDMKIDANPSRPVVSKNFTMKGINSESFLKTFMDFKQLSGKADASINIRTSGQTIEQFKNNISGKGSFTFRDGEIKGVNLVDILKNVQNKLTEFSLMGGSTKFVKMGGTFTANKSVFTNKDLSLLGPLVEASGNGYVDLTKDFINYRVIPFLTAAGKDAEVRAGIKIPVKIKGNFSNIKVKPDYKSVLKDALKDPEALKAMGKDLEKTGKHLLENKDQLKEVGKELLKDPEALKNLFGGFGR